MRLFLALLATLCTAQLAGIGLQSQALHLTDQQLEFSQMVLTAVCFHGAALVWVNFFLREAQISWREAFGLGLQRLRRTASWGMATAAGFLPVGLGFQFLINLLLPNPVAQPAVRALESTGATSAEKIFMGALAVFLAPLAEEILFRGILYPTIKQCGYRRTGIWVTSLLFGAMHFNVSAFAPLVLFSAVLIWLYEKTDSLWAPITAHSLFNLANLVFLLLFPQEAIMSLR